MFRSLNLASLITTTLAVLGVIALSVFVGLVAVTGWGIIYFLIVAMMGAVLLLFLSDKNLLLLGGLLVYLVVGQLMYFANIGQALWIPYGLGILLFLRLPSAFLKSPYAATKIGVPLNLSISFYFLIFLFSIALNETPIFQAIVGGKNLVIFWSYFLLIALFAIPFPATEKFVRWLLWIAVLQLPFVLYQYFVVVPERVNSLSSWDAIVGSFGGNQLAGGASGTMAYMLLLAVLLAMRLSQFGQMNRLLLLGITLTAGGIIFLAEVKFAPLLMFVGMAVVYRKTFVRNPAVAIAGGIAALALGLGLLVAYDKTHYADIGQESRDIPDLLDKTFGYSLDSQFINLETGEMGRNAALIFWWEKGFLTDPLKGTLGYGPGASRSSSHFSVGQVARKYSFGIDRSAATQLLWELGLAGFLAFVYILLKGALLALRAANSTSSPASAAILETAAAGLVMAVLMLPYNRDVLEVPALTFTLMLLLGLAVQADVLRRLRREPFKQG
ncbi:MAG: hypothetical protein B7X93_12510 [Hydrogenophilales bacterium 17-61-9]|nr:MAG: hypothetical protein B7X93_12510 [Hydrogenophilales bacterium 17-61-9]